ncbi:MAG: DMT family transporter [Bacteroidales bacterium]|nr:DMT family transporter [Candidatus Scybalousia scybalohippi]MCQ2327067.1 DMT family transporter [Bacteroidales bacterium]
MNKKVKGIIAGIIAAVSYGTNNLGALSLYEEGLNPNSIIFFRYLFAVAILGIILLCKKESFRVSFKELRTIASLGILFALSSLSLYFSFKYMDSGVASTILFAYPVMVAIIMAVFFKEKTTLSTILAIVLSALGIILLYQGDGNVSLSLWGVILVLISSLTYAIYIVIVNHSKIVMSSFKQTFYTMIFGSLTVFVASLFQTDTHIQCIPSISALMWILELSLVPTVIALVLLTISVQNVGSTPAAILGALEPVTAVIISIVIFDGLFTSRLMIGIILVILSVVLIILGKSIDGKFKHKKLDY